MRILNVRDSNLNRYAPLMAFSIVLFVANHVDAQFLYWSESERPGGICCTSTSIMRSRTDGTNVEVVISEPFTNFTFSGIAFDAPNGHLYGGDSLSVFRANVDGTGRQDIVTSASAVGDVELDLVNGKVYWSEVGGPNSGVRRANLDGSGIEQLFLDSRAVEGIALDLQAGKVYFTHSVNPGQGDNDTIQVMDLDGMNRQISVDFQSTTVDPHDIEIDLVNGKLYWNEFAAGVAANSVIRSAMLDGTGVALVLNPPSLTGNGIHYDPVNDDIYFHQSPSLGAGEGDTIGRISSDGSGLETVISRPQFTNINYLETVVPEPSTAVLCVAGIAIIGLLRIRRPRNGAFNAFS